METHYKRVPASACLLRSVYGKTYSQVNVHRTEALMQQEPHLVSQAALGKGHECLPLGTFLRLPPVEPDTSFQLKGMSPQLSEKP